METESPKVIGRISTRDVEVGNVVSVTDHVCAVRTAGGFAAVQRICPHAGADLANGYEDGGYLRCAWHNIPFDLGTGASPISSVKDLKVYAVRQVGPDEFEVLDRE